MLVLQQRLLFIHQPEGGVRWCWYLTPDRNVRIFCFLSDAPRHFVAHTFAFGKLPSLYAMVCVSEFIVTCFSLCGLSGCPHCCCFSAGALMCSTVVFGFLVLFDCLSCFIIAFAPQTSQSWQADFRPTQKGTRDALRPAWLPAHSRARRRFDLCAIHSSEPKRRGSKNTMFNAYTTICRKFVQNLC
jgi:hypothetical protein